MVSPLPSHLLPLMPAPLPLQCLSLPALPPAYFFYPPADPGPADWEILPLLSYFSLSP